MFILRKPTGRGNCQAEAKTCPMHLWVLKCYVVVHRHTLVLTPNMSSRACRSTGSLLEAASSITFQAAFFTETKLWKEG